MAKADSTEGTEGMDKGDEPANETDDGRTSMRTWLSLVEAISDLTKYDWEKTFKMCVVEFFSFLSYVNYKRKKQEQEIREFKIKNKLN